MEKKLRPDMDVERREFCQRVSASGLPVFSLDPGEYPDEFLIWDQIKPDLPKVLVITIPRSGTHFTGKLLENMGLIYGGLHLSPSLETDVVEDRRARKMSPVGKLTFRRYNIPILDIFKMVGRGQFVQGHVRYQEDFAEALKDFKIIYVKRDLRGVAVSSMRFITHLSEAGHVFAKHWDTRWIGLVDGPLKMYGYLQSFGMGLPELKKAIEPWQNVPNAFVLDFDRLTSGDEDESESLLLDLGSFLNVSLEGVDLKALLSASTEVETLTWTGKLSRWQDFWSDEVEATFQNNIVEGRRERYVSKKMQDSFDGLTNVEYHNNNNKSVISWMTQNEIETRLVDTDQAADYVNFLPDVLSTRLGMTGKFASINLGVRKDVWLLEGCEVQEVDEWLVLSSLDGFETHKHLGIPINLEDSISVCTFSLILDKGFSSRYLMLQVGNDDGFYNGLFDTHEVKASQLQNFGECRNLCSRLDRLDHKNVKLSICGFMASIKGAYARMYLSDNRGSIDFNNNVSVKIKELKISYGLEIFEFNDPTRRDTGRR